MTAHILFEEICFENEEVESSQSSKQRQTFRVDLDSFQHLRVEDEDAFDVEGLVHIQQDLVEEKREFLKKVVEHKSYSLQFKYMI